MIRTVIRLALAALLLLGVAVVQRTPAQRTPPGLVDLTFRGSVDYASGNSLTMRNPDGSFATITARAIPDRLQQRGAALTATLRFDSAAHAFNDAACMGRVSLAAPGSAGACGAGAALIAVSGPAGLDPIGGAAVQTLGGLDLVADPATGRFTTEMPGGSYAFAPVAAGPATNGTPGAIGGIGCTGALGCLGGLADGSVDPGSLVGSGFQTLANLAAPVTSGLGLARTETGGAGDATIDAAAAPTAGSPTKVPEPGMLPLFGGAVLALAFVRWRRRAGTIAGPTRVTATVPPTAASTPPVLRRWLPS